MGGMSFGLGTKVPTNVTANPFGSVTPSGLTGGMPHVVSYNCTECVVF